MKFKENLPQEKAYTTFQIADICGVQPTTIIQWIKQKKMNSLEIVEEIKHLCMKK